MGLGKTLQCVTTCHLYTVHHKLAHNGVAPRIIVVCPPTILKHWWSEVEKFNRWLSSAADELRDDLVTAAQLSPAAVAAAVAYATSPKHSGSPIPDPPFFSVSLAPFPATSASEAEAAAAAAASSKPSSPTHPLSPIATTSVSGVSIAPVSPPPTESKTTSSNSNATTTTSPTPSASSVDPDAPLSQHPYMMEPLLCTLLDST
jgi:hypothetical protein